MKTIAIAHDIGDTVYHRSTRDKIITGTVEAAEISLTERGMAVHYKVRFNLPNGGYGGVKTEAVLCGSDGSDIFATKEELLKSL